MTQVVIQFLDKLGNVVEGNTTYVVVNRELPKQKRRRTRGGGNTDKTGEVEKQMKLGKFFSKKSLGGEPITRRIEIGDVLRHVRGFQESIRRRNGRRNIQLKMKHEVKKGSKTILLQCQVVL